MGQGFAEKLRVRQNLCDVLYREIGKKGGMVYYQIRIERGFHAEVSEPCLYFLTVFTLQRSENRYVCTVDYEYLLYWVQEAADRGWRSSSVQ